MTHKELLLEPALKKWYQYKAEKKDIVFEKIDNNQINNLLNIFYRSGEVIVDTIRKELNMAATLVKINVDQIPYNKVFSKNVIEYHAEIANDYSWLLPRELVSVLLSRSLGFVNQDLLTKEMTELEKEMTKSILEIITKSSYVFWLGALEMAEDLSINVDPKDNKKIHKEELVIQVSMIMELGEYGKFPIIFFSTTANIKKFLDKFDALTKEKKQNTISLEGNSVSNIYVPVEIILGNTDVQMNDVLSMQAGDVFQLDQKVGSPVIVKMGAKAEFVSFLGRKGDELIVRVEDLKGSKVADTLISKSQKIEGAQVKVGSSNEISQMNQEQKTPEIKEEDIKNVFDENVFDDGNDHGDEIVSKIESTDPDANNDDDFNWDIDDL